VDVNEKDLRVTLTSGTWFAFCLLATVAYLWSLSTLSYPTDMAGWMKVALCVIVFAGTLYGLWGTSRIVHITSRETLVRNLFGLGSTHVYDMHDLIGVAEIFSGRQPKLLLRFKGERTVALYQFQHHFSDAAIFLRKQFPLCWP